MINDGLIDAFNNYHMGVTAENVAKKFNISRQEQDEFALNSQKKTEKALKDNKFSDELVRINHSGNILDKDRVAMAGNEVDLVFHLAAVKNIEISEFNPIETVDANINGTINLIKIS